MWERHCHSSYPLLAKQLQENEGHSWREQFFVRLAHNSIFLTQFLILRSCFEIWNTGGLKLLVPEFGLSVWKPRSVRRNEKSNSRTGYFLPNARVDVSVVSKFRWTDELNIAAGNMSPQPKNLFQKTKSEASRIQKSMFGSQMRPPMITAKSYRVSNGISAKPPSLGKSLAGTRVVVKPVAYRRIEPLAPTNPSPQSVSISPGTAACADSSIEKPGTSSGKTTALDRDAPPSPTRPIRPMPSKKDPKSSLFMPKHRAHSQLSGYSGPFRGTST